MTISAVPPPSPYRADLRVGDTERTATCEVLSIHFAEGRLTPDELDTRLEAATVALTRADLRRLTVDLPEPAAMAAPPAHLRRQQPPGPVGPGPIDVLIGIGIVGALGLIMVMLFGIGMVNPMMFMASVVGGMLAFGVGAGGTHLLHRALHRRG